MKEDPRINRLKSMSIIARIAAVFALSLSLPKMIGIGPSMITPPVLILDSTFLSEGFS